MVSIAGGKLTTYRRIALDALDRLRPDLGLGALDRRPRPLPGAAGLSHVPFPDELPPETRSHLLELYGSLAADVLAPAREDPSLLEPLVPGRPDLAAQALYARRARMGGDGRRRAAAADDGLARRAGRSGGDGGALLAQPRRRVHVERQRLRVDHDAVVALGELDAS